MTLATALTFLDTFSGEVSGRTADYLRGEPVKCEAVGCPHDGTRVIHWHDGTPGGVLETVCDRDGSKLVHPSRSHLRAKDVTAQVTPVA